MQQVIVVLMHASEVLWDRPHWKYATALLILGFRVAYAMICLSGLNWTRWSSHLEATTEVGREFHFKASIKYKETPNGCLRGRREIFLCCLTGRAEETSLFKCPTVSIPLDAFV